MSNSWDKWDNRQAQGRNAPISQIEVEERIVALTSSLESETEAFEALSIDHAKKEAEYKRVWHSEYLRAEGPVKEREAHAGYRTAEHHMEAQVAEAVMKAKREKLHTIRTALDSLRTLAANVRAQS
jgi:hypothetical protein